MVERALLYCIKCCDDNGIKLQLFETGFGLKWNPICCAMCVIKIKSSPFISFSKAFSSNLTPFTFLTTSMSFKRHFITRTDLRVTISGRFCFKLFLSFINLFVFLKNKILNRRDFFLFLGSAGASFKCIFISISLSIYIMCAHARVRVCEEDWALLDNGDIYDFKKSFHSWPRISVFEFLFFIYIFFFLILVAIFLPPPHFFYTYLLCFRLFRPNILSSFLFLFFLFEFLSFLFFLRLLVPSFSPSFLVYLFPFSF